MRLAVIAVIFLVAVGVLVGVGIGESAIPVVKYARLTDPAASAQGRVIVDDTRIRKIESLFPLRFSVAPEGSSGEPMRVESSVPPPENFKVGGPVVLRGTYDPKDHVFDATMISTKCPSRYDVEREMKEVLEEPEGASKPPAPGMD